MLKLSSVLNVDICFSCKMHYYRNIELVFKSVISVKSEDFNNKVVEQINLLTYCKCSIYNTKSCWSCKFKKSIIELKGKVPTFGLARKNPQPFRKFVFIFPTLAFDELLKDKKDKDKKPKIGDQEGGDCETLVSVFRSQPEKSPKNLLKSLIILK